MIEACMANIFLYYQSEARINLIMVIRRDKERLNLGNKISFKTILVRINKV